MKVFSPQAFASGLAISFTIGVSFRYLDVQYSPEWAWAILIYPTLLELSMRYSSQREEKKDGGEKKRKGVN